MLESQSMISVYYYVGIFSTVVFVIKIIMFYFGAGDSEVSADFNSEVETDASFNFLSLQSILAFLMGFSWMGFAGLKQLGLGGVKTLIIALFVGLIFMTVNATLMFLVRKLEKTVVKDKNEALGKVGKAYTYFEANSTGQVEININDQLSVVNAVNNTKEPINAFDQVKVVKVENELLYVEKIN